ncbi:hypothetical protein [Rhodococcus aetherivorans]|uniref:hypothetical protein n=1 Tax=Rhodococcus aetherivorans TaxID=191292 RepID=UPI0036619AC6
MKAPHFRWYFLVWLCGATGVVLFSILAGAGTKYWDETQYLEIARNVASGVGYVSEGAPTAYRPPAWPLILAAPLALRLPEPVVYAVPAALLVLGSIVAWVIGARLVSYRGLARYPAGPIAALLVLLYPLNVYTTGTLYPQMLATLLLLGMWLIVSNSLDRGRRRIRLAPISALGLFCAVLTLAVPTMIFSAVVILGWVIWKSPNRRSQLLLCGGGAFALPISVWGYRNMNVVGAFVPFSTSTGVNLLLGNNDNASGSSGVDVDVLEYQRYAASLNNEVDASAYLQGVAIDWIFDNRGSAAGLYLFKVLNYFSAYNEPATQGQGGQIAAVVAWVSFLAMVTLTVARVILRRVVPMLPSESLFLLVFVLNAFAMAVFFTRTRFRQPLDNILLVEAAIGIVSILVAVRCRRSRPVNGLTDVAVRR